MIMWSYQAIWRTRQTSVGPTPSVGRAPIGERTVDLTQHVARHHRPYIAPEPVEVGPSVLAVVVVLLLVGVPAALGGVACSQAGMSVAAVALLIPGLWLVTMALTVRMWYGLVWP